jgi:hypothetical protein
MGAGDYHFYPVADSSAANASTPSAQIVRCCSYPMRSVSIMIVSLSQGFPARRSRATSHVRGCRHRREGPIFCRSSLVRGFESADFLRFRRCCARCIAFAEYQLVETCRVPKDIIKRHHVDCGAVDRKPVQLVPLLRRQVASPTDDE